MVRSGGRGPAAGEEAPAEVVYGALLAGSERGLSYDDNTRAFGELGFATHVAGLPDKRDLSTTVMGEQISLPVVISPTGELMLCWPCDLIVAAENAQFSDPVVHMGIGGVEYHGHTWELGPR